MDSVIEHILARKNCAAPPNDGRKIALVHYGGIMSGVVGTGVFTALDELGLRGAFDEIYTFSAGFPNAAYFLAGQAKLSTTVYAEDLCGRDFINWFTPWRVANIDNLLNVLEFKKRLDVEKVINSKTELRVWIKNYTTHETQFVSAHPQKSEDFFKLLRAGVTMEYLAPGAIEYQGQFFKDAEPHRRLFLDSVLKYSTATDFFVVYNRPSQAIAREGNQGKNIFEFIPNFELSRFETAKEKLYAAAKRGYHQIQEIFR